MSPDRSSFTALNVPSTQIPAWMGSFCLSAPPNTDLWRKPPAQNISTAPILFTSLCHPFIAAEVTVSADWELEWDQGGLVIFAGSPQGIRSHPSDTPTNIPGSILPPPASQAAPPSDLTQQPQPTPQSSQPAPPPPYTTPNAPKWVKLGLEYTSTAPHASSVVATSDGADWCLSALPSAYASGRRADLRIKMERIGYALWLWYLDDSLVGGSGGPPGPPAYFGGSPNMAPGMTPGMDSGMNPSGGYTTGGYPGVYPGGPGAGYPGVWKKLREVTWFFWGVEDKAVRVGVYACRPVAGGAGANRSRSVERRDLCVEFEGLEIF